MHETAWITIHATMHNTSAEFAGLTTRQRMALVEDVMDLMTHENVSDAREAFRTLLSRIRPATLDSYARTLLAGQDRRATI